MKFKLEDSEENPAQMACCGVGENITMEEK